MTPDLWFSVTDWTQFAVLLPIGVLFGYLIWGRSVIGTGYRALAYGRAQTIFWVFLLTSRAITGRVPWQASIGTMLLNSFFVVAVYLGARAHERRHK